MYYDKYVNKCSLKIRYIGNLSFYYRGEELWSDRFEDDNASPGMPKVYEEQNVIFGWDDFIKIDIRNPDLKSLEILNIVVGLE